MLNQPRSSDRRTEICEAALDLAAAGGSHAVTHEAIDRRLGIAPGLTSQYFRSRELLVMAAVTHLATLTREAFAASVDATAATEHTVEGPVNFLVAQLESLLGPRRRDVLARYALLPDAGQFGELRAALSRCLFNPEAAEELMGSLGVTDPEDAARDLVGLLEGLLFDGCYGLRAGATGGASHGVDDLRRPVARWFETIQ